jgi:hypothetical protein
VGGLPLVGVAGSAGRKLGQSEQSTRRRVGDSGSRNGKKAGFFLLLLTSERLQGLQTAYLRR